MEVKLWSPTRGIDAQELFTIETKEFFSISFNFARKEAGAASA
jgi:hypothetical protein